MLAEQKAYLESIIETQNARITELETMVYGSKQKPRSGSTTKTSKVLRDAASYRRPIPRASAIQTRNIARLMSVATAMVH